MKTKKMTLQGRALRAALALVLAVGLVPSQALTSNAYAAAGDGSSSDAAPVIHSEDVALDQGAAAQDSEGAAAGQAAEDPSAADAAEGSTSADTGKAAGSDAGTAANATDTPAAQPSAGKSTASTPEADDMLNVQVNVADGADAGAAIAFGGLVYVVNDAEAHTVTLTGWTGTAPQGALSIPQTIRNGQTEYSVSEVAIAGGGASLNADPEGVAAENGEDPAEAGADPYTTEYFDAAAKAPGVTSVHIPASVRAIDPAFFQQFPGAASISVAADNPSYISHNGMLFGANEAAEATSLLLVPEGMEGAAVLPSTLATVPACVLTRCHKLSAIVFPDGGTGSDSLAARNGILYTADLGTLLAAPAGLGTSATLAPETRAIAEGAFLGNDALDTLVVAGDVESIEGDAFSQQAIQNATVALTGDFSRAAWEAAGFTHFGEPAAPGEQIAPVEGSGFAFTLLDDYTLAVGWQGDDPTPAALRIPAYGMLNGVQYAVSAIAEGGFAGQQSIVTVDMPETVTEVGARAFEGCGSLQTANLANAVQRIGTRAFADTALLGVVLPTDLETLGQEAFAGLTGTTVVALAEPGLVADSAFAGGTGLSLYVPAREDGAYAIGAGLPASGNHVYPYGVRLAAESRELAEGESANLFQDGGILEAPGQVQVDYAYKARPISVDPETGDVQAKQVGSSDVQVSLTLDVPTVYVNDITSDEVRLEKASLGEDSEAPASIGEVFEGSQEIALASAAAMYSVNMMSAGISPQAEGEVVEQDGLVFTELSDGTYSVKAKDTTLSGDVVIPSKIGSGKYVTMIPGGAFSKTPITSVYIPASITSIDSNSAFDLCSNLKSIDVAASSTSFMSIDGVLYSKNDAGKVNGLLRYPPAKTGDHFTIPEGVTYTGPTPMGDNGNLKTISIPTSVTSIEKWFCANNPNLEILVIPDSVTSLGANTVGSYGNGGCVHSKFSSVTFGKGITAIPGTSFPHTPALADIYVRGNITSIGNGSFADTPKETCTVHLPDGYTAAQKKVWEDFGFKKFASASDGLLFEKKADGNLKVSAKSRDLKGDVVIPAKWSGIDKNGVQVSNATVDEIPAGGFRFTNITSLQIPATVKTIASYSFVDECFNLMSIEVLPDNKTFASYNGALYSRDATGNLYALLRYPAGKRDSHVDVKEGVREIANTGIGDNKYIHSVYIPDSVTYIGPWFLQNVPNIETLTIPDTVTNFNGLICAPHASADSGDYAKFTKLKSVTLGKGVTRITASNSDGASFRTASSLENIYVHGTVSSIDNYCFQDVNKDKCIVWLPSGATDAHKKIWTDRGFKLENIRSFNDNLAFEKKEDGTLKVKAKNGTVSGAIVIPERWTGTDINGVKVTDAVVTEVGTSSFPRCAITSISIPSTVTYIDSNNFVDGCLDLERIEVDAGNKKYRSIEGALYSKDESGNPYALLRYPSGKKDFIAEIAPGTKEIGHTGVADNRYMRSIVIPSSVWYVGSWFLQNTPNIESLTIPDTVTTCNGQLCPPHKSASAEMQSFSKLTSITLGRGVTQIRGNAFSTAINLGDIYVRGTVSSIEDGCFANVDKETCVVHLPNTATDADKKVWTDKGFKIANLDTESFSTTFNAGDGAFLVDGAYQKVISSIEFTPGLTIHTPDYDCLRAGYTLDYWYTLDGSTEKKWDFATDRAYGPVTLYAKWKPVTYTVNLVSPDHPDFVGPDGNAVAKQWKVAFEASSGVGGPDFKLPAARFLGYTLEGWYTSYDEATGTYGGNKITNAGNLNIKNYVPGYGNSAYVDGNDAYVSESNTITLYAKWVEKTYTVHFRSAPGGADMSTATANYETSSAAAGGTASAATVTLPTKHAAAIDGQYYTQWGTRASGTAAQGNLVKDASEGDASVTTPSTVAMKEIIDGAGGVSYVDVPSGSTIYDITDVYFYPQWRYIEYTLQYGQNTAADGDGAPKVNAKLPGDKATITYRPDGIYLNGTPQANGIALEAATGFGEGYAFKGWGKSASGSVVASSNTLTRANFADFFDLEYSASKTDVSRSQRLVPLWDEFTYNVTLHNTDAAGAATSESEALGTGMKYHDATALSLAQPSGFTVPKGMKAGGWHVDAANGAQAFAMDGTVTVADIVAATDSANKGSAGAATELKLYLGWINRTDLTITVYQVYEGTTGEAQGAYPADPANPQNGEDVVAKVSANTYTNGGRISFDADVPAALKAPKAGFVLDEDMTAWMNDPAHGGSDTVKGNDSALYVYFKKLYNVEFKVGAGGASTVAGGKFAKDYTYAHENGAVKGVATKMSQAVADLAAAASDFETPTAGCYFDDYVFSGSYESSTAQDENTSTFTITGTDDINADASYTAVFKAIEYRMDYAHSYDADKGMPAEPSEALQTKTFTYADAQAGGVDVANVGNAELFKVPVGYVHTGWMPQGGTTSVAPNAKVELSGDAGDTFAALGFSAQPEADHESYQQVTLDATWDYKQYQLKFWKYTDEAATSAVAVEGVDFDTARFSLESGHDGFTLPDQDNRGGEGHPYIDDTTFGYALTSWSTAGTPDGTAVSAGASSDDEALHRAGEACTVRQLLFGRTGALADPVEREDGVIDLYATWTPVYSVAVPTGSEIISFDIDIATGETKSSAATAAADGVHAQAKVESNTPRELDVDAYAEVVADGTTSEPNKASTAGKLFVRDVAEGKAIAEADVAAALREIELTVQAEAGGSEAVLPLGDSTPKTVISDMEPAAPDAPSVANPLVGLSLPSGQYINPRLNGDGYRVDEENSRVYRDWGDVARIVWVVSDSASRDQLQWLYPSESAAYRKSTE